MGLAEILLLLPPLLLAIFAPIDVELSLLLRGLCILASGISLLGLCLLLLLFYFGELSLGLGVRIRIGVIRISTRLGSRWGCAGGILALSFSGLLFREHGGLELSARPLLGLLLCQFQIDLIIPSLEIN